MSQDHFQGRYEVEFKYRLDDRPAFISALKTLDAAYLPIVVQEAAFDLGDEAKRSRTLPDPAAPLTAAIDGDKLTALRVSRQSDSQLCFVLREVQRRHIQRMCAAAGLQVKAVRRIRIGRVRLGELQQGQWRYLTETQKS